VLNRKLITFNSRTNHSVPRIVYNTKEINSMILILDLDDTIFETNSMDMSIFDPARKVIEEYTVNHYGQIESDNIINEIKQLPFDTVANKYNFPIERRNRFYYTIQNIPYNLNLSVFSDYSFLQQIDCDKYLVTTGMTNLQTAKIKALSIHADFQEIYIDDPFDTKRKFKKGIFQEIVKKTDNKEVWVIGDNPESELLAGKELGLKTIQRLKNNKKSIHADYEIRAFDELKRILT
jgi:putative hydrolase of the HAD superfamily